MHFRALLAGGLLLASVPIAFAQAQFVDPAVVLKDDALVGVAWNLQGGQQVSERFKSGVKYWKYSCDLSLYDTGLLSWAIDQVNTSGRSVGGGTYALYSIQKAARISNAGTFGVEVSGVNDAPRLLKMTLPECDSSSKEQDGVSIEFASNTKSPKSVSLPLIYTQSPKRTKLYHRALFKLQIAGLPTESVTKVRPVVIDPTFENRFAPSPLIFTIPTEAAAPFREWLRKNDSGGETYVDMVLSYLDDDGSTIMSFSCPVTPVAVDVTNPLLPADSPDNSVTVICKFPGDKTPIIKGSAL